MATFSELAMRTALNLTVLIFMLLPAANLAAGNVDLPRYPSISPDGSKIIFSWRGDLWKVAATGGRAERLTSHPADELRSAWSPDGRMIAFESDRTGSTNLFTINADGTNVRQVTHLDGSVSLNGFSLDGTGGMQLTFTAAIEGDVYRDARVYSVPLIGGLHERIHDAFGKHAIHSPDGRRVLFTRGGSSWSRRHYLGSDDRDVWLYDIPTERFTRLTDWTGNDGKALWRSDEAVVFLSDREDDCVNLYQLNLGDEESAPIRLTFFDTRDVWDHTVSADGSVAAFVAWDTLYTLDLRDPGAEPTALDITANEDERDNYELLSVGDRVSEAALSPDGQVLAVVAYGEVYVRHIEDDRPTRRVTRSHARESGIAWSPDGLKLYFTSDRDGTDSIYVATVVQTRDEIKSAFNEAVGLDQPAEEKDEQVDDEDDADEDDADDDNAAGSDDEEGDPDDAPDEEEDELPKELDPTRWHDAVEFAIEPVVTTATNDREPRPSPDGTSLSFRRGRGDIIIRNLNTGDERILITGWDSRIDWRWSPDAQHVAYSQDDRDFNTDVWIVAADGSVPPVNISRHPDNDVAPRWSADGKILCFRSERINEEYDVWAVYLDRELEALTETELKEYYDLAAKNAKKRKPLNTRPDKNDAARTGEDTDEAVPQLDLEDAYLRLRRVTSLDGNEGNLEITPAGDLLVFTGSYGESGLFSVKWDGSDRKRLTGSVNVQHVSLTGDKVVYVRGGSAGTVNPTGGSPEQIGIGDRIRIDLREQSSQKFLEAARIMDETFYHPTMKDLDWNDLTERYHKLARQARTADEFNYVAGYFLGELNGSHLGIRARESRDVNTQPMGRIGVDYVAVEGGFRIVAIVPDSPAARGPMALQVDDVITGIDFRPIEPGETLEQRLEGRIGEETVFDARRVDGAGVASSLRLLLTPISSGAERALKYEAWQRRNATLVHDWSDGRLGYLHIRGMNIPSLQEFERDLFAAAEGRDGLVIDVRNNGGGHTADYVLASIMVRPHAYTVPRGADPSYTEGYPQDRLFIQRYTKPVNMLCNEKSFSNAEIISHAFKTLGRGTLVGQETYGGVISTGGTTLIDGTSVRLPFRGWYLLDGTDMENNGATPDIIVEQTPEHESTEFDAQLKAAVDDLLERLD